MKKCKKCGLIKDESEFYGVQGECKECTKKAIRLNAKSIKMQCEICGKEFGTCTQEIKRGGGRFCSRKCYYEYQRNTIKKGKESHAWKGGRLKQQGYIKIYNPEHKHCDCKGYVFEHILVMEKHLDRVLKDEEVVHHINENKSDNRLENLMLFPNSGSHTKFHHRIRKEKAIGDIIRTCKKKCNKCKELLNIDNFGKAKKNKDGYRHTCNKCRNLDQRIRRGKK